VRSAAEKKLPPVGTELSSKYSRKPGSGASATRAATQIGDKRLAAIVAAWDRLPEAVKEELERIASEANEGKPAGLAPRPSAR
jgi:hypothetical protein